MIGFVEAIDGVCALADIKSVQQVGSADGRAECYLLRRKSEAPPLKMFAHNYRALEARPVQIMPAEPGTFLIHVFVSETEGEEAFADKTPILGWALCMDGQVRPITPAGVSRGFNPDSTRDWHPEYIELPDGAIYEFGYEAEPDRHHGVGPVLAAECRRQDRYAAERRERAEARPAAVQP